MLKPFRIRRRKASYSKRLAVFLVVIAPLAGAAWLASLSHGFAGDAYYTASLPVRTIGGYVMRGWHTIGSFFITRNELQHRLSVAEAEVRILRESLGELAQTKEALVSLRAALKDPLLPAIPRMEARVAGKGSNVFGDTLLIRRGSDEGVGVGDIVITGSRTLVGRVTSVTPSFSRVILVGNRDFRAAAEIIEVVTSASPTEDARTSPIRGAETVLAEGLVRGRGFGYGTIDMVPSGTLLKKGDYIFTSGFDGSYPDMLLVGQVGAITTAPSDLFQSAEIDTAVDVGSLATVFVLQWPGSASKQ